MSDGGGQENDGSNQRTDSMTVQHRVNDLVCAPVITQTKDPIDPDRQQTAQGQQENQSGILQTQVSNKMQCVVE